MGRELHALMPAAPYAELDGVGHFVIFEDPSAWRRKSPGLKIAAEQARAYFAASPALSAPAPSASPSTAA